VHNYKIWFEYINFNCIISSQPCAIYHIPSENVSLKSEIFTQNIKECPIIKILILITGTNVHVQVWCNYMYVILCLWIYENEWDIIYMHWMLLIILPDMSSFYMLHVHVVVKLFRWFMLSMLTDNLRSLKCTISDWD
jgi:hypothetical protein